MDPQVPQAQEDHPEAQDPKDPEAPLDPQVLELQAPLDSQVNEVSQVVQEQLDQSDLQDPLADLVNLDPLADLEMMADQEQEDQQE